MLSRSEVHQLMYSKLWLLIFVDRLSDLPDFIIHHIISFLDSKAAYRTSILSKRWRRIAATNPVLEFHNFDNLDYLDTRMQIYRKENLCIKDLSFIFPRTNVVPTCKVDEWVGIAVHNQVLKFCITGLDHYRLPEFLFSAKTLTHLKFFNGEIPYYKTVEFVSLESLKLYYVALEDGMLDHIISSCPLLKELWVSHCTGFTNIVIPRSSVLETLRLSRTIPKGGNIILETSTLNEFLYISKDDDGSDDSWPIVLKPGAFRSLRILDICDVGVTDDVLTELLSESTLLERLEIWRCHMLNRMKISSTCIKEIYLNGCSNLLEVVIDAPSLKKFKFNGKLRPPMLSISNNQASCEISVHTQPVYLNTNGFVKLKRLLTSLNCRNFFKLALLHETHEVTCDDIRFNEEELGDVIEEELGDVHLGPPRYVRELRLCFLPWRLTESSLSAFMNALFWICRPDIISLRIDLSVPNLTVEAFIGKLKNMAKCWKHPLKLIKVDNTDRFGFLYERKLYIRLRLFW